VKETDHHKLTKQEQIKRLINMKESFRSTNTKYYIQRRNINGGWNARHKNDTNKHRQKKKGKN
jgi:hypothetical protein